MSRASRDDLSLFAALAKEAEIQGTDCEILFHANKRLIDVSMDELGGRPSHPHPLRSFYKKYTRRIWGKGHTVFTPYSAGVPVVDTAGVREVFGRLKQPRRLPRFRLAGAREYYHLDPRRQVIGILTAGGNAPGLNTVIDSVVKRHSLLATKAGAEMDADGKVDGLEIWGYLNGYRGLVGHKKVQLTVRLTDRASLAPGSILGIKRGELPSSRASEDGISEKKAQTKISTEMAEAVEHDRLDILYVVGGNGTITAADWLCQCLGGVRGPSGKPVRVVAAPKTMDNDVNFTDITFGFRTTVENAVNVIQRIHTEAETCGRIAIVELFGAASGFVALHASYASGEVDYVLIPEMLPEPGNKSAAAARSAAEKRRAEVDKAADRIAARYRKRGHAVLVVAEGASARFDKALGEFRHGAKREKQAAFDRLVTYVSARINRGCHPKPRVFTSQPKHLIRSGPPNSDDIDLCKQTGKLMVDAALAGTSRCVVSLWHGRFVLVPMRLATAQLKRVNIGGYYFLSMMEKYLV